MFGSRRQQPRGRPAQGQPARQAPQGPEDRSGPVSRKTIGLRSERGALLLGLMLSTALIAFDSTVIATAVPSIVRDVGGFAELPWLFSIYLLGQAITVPLCGKLADTFGRKPVLLVGIALFFVGSALCAVAPGVPALIAGRAVQGLGAGAVQPMTITVVGDIYTLEERAKVQGYLASMWGAASVAGPALGGALAEYLSWRWIFIINIPLCLVAAAIVVRSFKERVEVTRKPIDYLGATLLTGGCGLIILGVLEGGQAWMWASWTGIVVMGVGVLLMVVFVLVERRAVSPVLPLWVFRRRTLMAGGAVAVGVGGVVIGLSSYVPTYAQGVLGAGPILAGFSLATLLLGWPFASSQAGRLYLRAGFRRTALIGGTVVLLGSGLLLTLGEGSSVLQVAVICLVIGLGMGFVAAPTLIAAQSSVGWSDRGVVTANNLFCRALGSAVGAAVLGAITNATLDDLETPAALAAASHNVFIGVVVFAALILVASAFIPGGVPPSGADVEASPAL